MVAQVIEKSEEKKTFKETAKTLEMARKVNNFEVTEVLMLHNTQNKGKR